MGGAPASAPAESLTELRHRRATRCDTSARVVRQLFFFLAISLFIVIPAAAQSAADIAVFKSGPGEAAAGSDVSYAVTITNFGPDAASDATLTDPIPTGMTFVSATQDSGPTFSCSTPAVGDPGTVTCSIASLALNESADFTFVFHIPSNAAPGSSFVNTATGTTTSLDENPENDSGVAGTSTPAAAMADMGVTKSGPAVAGPDTDVTYTITLSNVGSAAATSVTLTDILPAAIAFVSFTQDSGPVMSCSAGATTTCTLASFPAGQTATFTLVGHVGSQVAPGTELTNAASVSATNDLNPENNTGQTTLVVSSVDVSVTKSGPPTALAGTNVSYTITVTNAGPDAASNVLLHDTIPPNTTLVSLTYDNGQAATCNGADCEILVLPSGLSTQFTATLSIGNTTSVTNTATVTSGNYDTDSSNNEASATTAVTPVADLGVTKTAPATVVASTDVSFDVAIENLGPSDAANVSLTDLLPAGTTFVSATQNSGPTFTCDATITCTRATFAAGATASFTFVLNVDPSVTGTLTNTATIATTTQDPNANNDSDTTSTNVTPAPAELSIEKTANVTSGAPGTAATYTIVVTNNGPGAATNVVVTDPLPDGVALTSASSTQGTCSGTTTVTCTIGTLTDGATATITLDVILPQNAGDVTNTASVTASEDDPDGGNDSASAAIAVASPAAIPAVSPLGLALLAIALAAAALFANRS